ncbi:MAG: FG-GAP repeat domain-containing protein [Planctomycetota bacterium]
MRTLLLVTLLGGLAVAQTVTPLQFAEGAQVNDAVYADINGDGLTDLAVSIREPERAINVYLQRKQGVLFTSEPDFRLAPVYKDAVVFAVADVHPDRGSEIVLVTAKGIFAWRPIGPEKERAVKLTDCNLLWQLPFYSAVAWPDCVADVNNDALPDFVIPEPEGYRVILQTERGKFAPGQVLIVPAGPEVPDPEELSSRSRRTRMLQKYSTRVQIGGGGGEFIQRLAGPLVDISDRVPAPQLRDWDADGDLDIIARTERRLYVWTQDSKGSFGKRPAVDRLMPVIADRKRRLEISYSAHTLDLDRDHKADFVIFSGDQRSKEIRTQVQFFTHRKGGEMFGEKGLPDQLLVFSGFAGIPRFDDVNNDGYPDLFAGAVRPDLLDTLRGAAARHLDAELYVFLNRKGRFPRQPDLLYRTKIEVEGMKPSRSAAVIRFFGDVTGDGVRDLLLRDSASRIKVLMARANRNGMQIISKPIFELRIDPKAGIRFGPSRGKRKAPDLVILESEQVLHVRFP